MLSMTNNLNELFRLLLILGSVIFVYVHAYSLLYLFQIPNLENSINFLHGAYLTAFFFVIFYECFRVTLIRVKFAARRVVADSKRKRQNNRFDTQ